MGVSQIILKVDKELFDVIFFSYNMLNRYILAEKIKEKPI
jgi:hypothetical protein